MIEEQTRPLEVDESQVEQLLERLLQQRDEKEKWYSRGRRDGEAWTQETATLNELHHFDEHWSGLEGMTVDDFNPDDLEGWIVELLPKEFRSNDLRQLPTDLQGAYIFGWREGVTNLWRVVRTRL